MQFIAAHALLYAKSPEHKHQPARKRSVRLLCSTCRVLGHQTPTAEKLLPRQVETFGRRYRERRAAWLLQQWRCVGQWGQQQAVETDRSLRLRQLNNIALHELQIKSNVIADAARLGQSYCVTAHVQCQHTVTQVGDSAGCCRCKSHTTHCNYHIVSLQSLF